MKNLKGIFEPRSVAIVGASSRVGSVGHSVLNNLIESGYQGKIFPINPKAEKILGLESYSHISKVNQDIDMAVLLLSPNITAQAIEDCAQKKIKGMVIISAGFKEVGGEGLEREEEVKAAARKHGITVIGPNCLGIINTDPKHTLNASFGRTMPRKGNIAFLSQSGALCTAVLDYAKSHRIGFSKFISIGNKADVNETDLIEYLGDDPETKVILMYIEDIVDAQHFIQVARHVTMEAKIKKPILAIKSGRTKQGAAAASSHTGSLAGSDNIYTAIFKQSAVIRVDSVEELFALAMSFSQPALAEGNRVAIVTNAGGPGIMTVDACVHKGLEIAKLSLETEKKLAQVLPPTANIHNPVDVIGDAGADRYAAAMDAVLADPGVDSMIVILTPQSMTDIDATAKAIVERKKSGKPIMSTFMGGYDIQSGFEILAAAQMPHFLFPESAAYALKKMQEFTSTSELSKSPILHFPLNLEYGKKLIQKNQKAGRAQMEMMDVFELLQIYGIKIPRYHVIRQSADLATLAGEIIFPVVIKILSPDIIHKIDIGGVVLNIQDMHQLYREIEAMLNRVGQANPSARVEGIFIQQMMPPGYEAILGANRDPKFGPLVMFGMGGSFVEVFKDVSFRLAPLTQRSACHMIESTKFYGMLVGARGKTRVDIGKVEETICKLSQLVCDYPEIGELDINPLTIYENEVVAVDTRITLVS